MRLRFLLIGLSVLVTAFVLVLLDDARRHADEHRRAQIAAERLTTTLHAVESLVHRAEEKEPGDLAPLAAEAARLTAEGRAATRDLIALRPRDASTRRTAHLVDRHRRVAASELALLRAGRAAAARALAARELEPTFRRADARLGRLLEQVTHDGDAAYRRGGVVIVGGLVAGLLLLLGLALAFARESRRAAVERTQRRQAALAERSADVITMVGVNGALQWQSSSAARVFGRAVPGAGAHVRELFDPQGGHLAEEAIARALLQPAGTGAFTAVIPGEDAALRAFETLVENRLRDPGVEAIVLTTRDVTERLRLEEELRRRAFHDELTGLPNRALFEDRLQHALAASSRGGRVAVLFIDLNDFKTVNDSLGHAAGDELLRFAAARLDEVLRGADTAARMGGDEFAILLQGIESTQEAEGVAERVLEALRRPMAVAGRAIAVRASVGIARSEPGDTPAEVLRNADVAMYAAKTARAGGWAVFDPGMHVEALTRLELSTELHAAIERGEFELYYQPIVGLDGHAAGGAEALVRWRHPRRGLLAPAEFIPIAESTGAIVELGRWVLAQACADLASWQAATGSTSLYVSVNVSEAQLAEAALVDHVRDALAASGVAAGDLMLEISERLFAREAGAAVARLRELKALGVRTAIDDFGTGHSALASLRRLPVDVLKIDRSFISEVTTESDSRTLLAGVLQLGRTLGLEIIAEGVELDAQAGALRSLGAVTAQGYLLAPPLPAAEVDPHRLLPAQRSR